jgi:putative phage-type endonuclease
VPTERERRATWLKERRQGIGASDVAIILGLSPWKSPLALFTEKLGLDNPDDADVEMSEPQKWGMRLENAVAQGFGEETGRHVVAGDPYAIARHPELPWLTATLDRRQQIVDGCELPPDFTVETGSIGALELKTAGFMKAEEWEEEPPLYYQVQLQTQLFVAELRWGSLAVLIGGQRFRYKDMERNDRFTRYMVQKCEAFWQCVLTGTPPPVDAHESTREALHKLFPDAIDAELVALPPEADDWHAQRIAAKEAIAAAKAQETEAENRLKAALGEHVAGFTPTGITYRWKNEPRQSYVVAACNPRVLRFSEPKKGKR